MALALMWASVGFCVGAVLTALGTMLGQWLGMRDWRRRLDAAEREYRGDK